jgi:tetratricopeptide (TPR) repeat protein
MSEGGLRMWRGLALGCAVMLAGCAASGGADEGRAADARAAASGGFGAYLAAHAARLRDDVGAASDNFQRTLAADPDNPDVLRLGLVYAVADGRFDAAEKTARTIAQARPGDMLAGYVLSVAAARGGDWKAAAEALAPIPENNLNGLLGPLLKAWIAAGAGDIDGGLAALKPLAEKKAFLPVANFHSALLLDFARRDAEAEAAYERTLSGDGGRSIHAMQAAGRFFNRIGKPERVGEMLDTYVAQHGDAPLAEALAERLQSRRMSAPMVGSAQEGMGEAFFSIASSLTNVDAWEVTLALAQLAVRVDPGLDLTQVLIGEMFEGHEDFERANRAYAAVPTDSVVAYSVRLRVAKNLERMDRRDEAAACLSDLAQRFPKRSEPLIELGDLYRGANRYEEAVTAYDGAFARLGAIERRHWVLFYTRGISLERAKQWPRAEADFLKALELEPDQPLVLNYLGYSWLDQGMHLDRAQAMIEKAVEQRPRDGYIVDSLGWAYYMRGNYAEAVKQLEQAVVLVADDPTINDHLGDAYWRTGRKLEARYQWERALGLNPEDQQVEEIRAKLRDGLK